MKKYVFIVTDANRSILQVGLSADLLQSVRPSQPMPNLLSESFGQIGRLVYFEELSNEKDAFQRFKLLNSFTRLQKERLIRKVNADWIDLGIALSYEQEVGYSGPEYFGRSSFFGKKAA